MSPLLRLSPEALAFLALGGAFTAVFAALVMLTQTDIKRKLAYSTVSQMGFMMLQCGLGAFAAAALHLVGHSFYKAYAFLASGTAVAPEVQPPAAGPVRPPGLATIALAITAGAVVVVAAAALLGVDPTIKAGLPVLASVLALAIAQLVLLADDGEAPLARRLPGTLGAGFAIAVAYFGGVALFEQLLGAAAPSSPLPAAPQEAALALPLIALFAAGLLLQTRIAAFGSSPASSPTGRTERVWQRLYVHASNGFYLGTLQNRLVRRLGPLGRVATS